jgi:hypothetical protein
LAIVLLILALEVAPQIGFVLRFFGGLAMNGRLMPLDPNRRCRIQYFWPWLGMAALIGLIWAELGRATERPFVLGQTSDETSVNLYLVEWE